jgi:hypothetical protein
MSRLFRAFAFLAFGILLGGTASYSFAGYAQLKPPATIGGTVGARITAGAFAVNNGNISVGFTTQVAGKTVTMPATLRFASNAARVALVAVRLSPAALVGSALAGYLLTYGIELAEGQFMKAASPSSPTYEGSCSQGGVTDLETCKQRVASAWAGWPFDQLITEGNTIYIQHKNADTGQVVKGAGIFQITSASCPAGSTSNGTQCVGAAVPATQNDWDTVEASPLPDDVAEELTGKGVPLPLENPQFDPTPQNIPLSDPYPKPNGQPGETVKDVAKVTPAPDEKAKIETVVEPVTGPNGVPIPTTNPDGSSNPDAAPEEKPDFCIENPDALACWKDGSPEDVDLQKVTAGTSIVPVNIGGGGSCPASKTVNYMGANLVISFTPICTAAGWINPIVLALAWLSAGFILIGAFKQG